MAQNLFDINGKVTVMTGACGVLGATIVKYFASQGSKVVLLDLERARETGTYWTRLPWSRTARTSLPPTDPWISF